MQPLQPRCFSVPQTGDALEAVDDMAIGWKPRVQNEAQQLAAREDCAVSPVRVGGVSDGKVALVAAVTPDLANRVHAGKIIGEVAKVVGGRGGGKPDLAQAAGTDASKLRPSWAAPRA